MYVDKNQKSKQPQKPRYSKQLRDEVRKRLVYGDIKEVMRLEGIGRTTIYDWFSGRLNSPRIYHALINYLESRDTEFKKQVNHGKKVLKSIDKHHKTIKP